MAATLHDKIMAFHAVNAAAEAIIDVRGNVIPPAERSAEANELAFKAARAALKDAAS